jgi:hypothetical protein
MADARNGDVDAMDHHQVPTHRLSGQRAALMRLELTTPRRLPNDYGRHSGRQGNQAAARALASADDGPLSKSRITPPM